MGYVVITIEGGLVVIEAIVAMGACIVLRDVFGERSISTFAPLVGAPIEDLFCFRLAPSVVRANFIPAKANAEISALTAPKLSPNNAFALSFSAMSSKKCSAHQCVNHPNV